MERTAVWTDRHEHDSDIIVSNMTNTICGRGGGGWVEIFFPAHRMPRKVFVPFPRLAVRSAHNFPASPQAHDFAIKKDSIDISPGHCLAWVLKKGGHPCRGDTNCLHTISL